MTQASSLSLHANAVALGETGLLLRGPSGSGKSALTLELMARFDARGDFARLVGDDRINVERHGGRLVALGHPATTGMIEARGMGLLRVPFETACVVNGVVDVCAPGAAPQRYPDPAEKSVTLLEVELPRLTIPSASDASLSRIIIFIQQITTF